MKVIHGLIISAVSFLFLGCGIRAHNAAKSPADKEESAAGELPADSNYGRDQNGAGESPANPASMTESDSVAAPSDHLHGSEGVDEDDIEGFDDTDDRDTTGVN